MTTLHSTVLEDQLPWIRAQFPGLESDWAFFDNAGGSQVLASVAERVREYLLSSSVQLGASYEVSQRAASRVASGVASAARLINARSPREVVLGSSTTQLMANLAAAIAPSLRPGDEIIVTNADHEANIGAWERLSRQGFTLKVWEVDPQRFTLPLEGLEALLTPRTRLVCCAHVSNVLGSINPIREIAQRVHGVGAKLAVDGVAYAPHRRVDVQALDADFYLFSFYKVFGPHLALLYGREEHLLGLANLNHFFIAPEDIPYKLQPGNVNYELTYSLGAVLAYLEALGERLAPGAEPLEASFQAIARHEAALCGRLLDALRTHPKVTFIGSASASPAERVATVSFTVQGSASSEIVRRLDQAQLAVRYGHFYARRLMDALHLDPHEGVVRVSLAHYNTPAEVDRLVDNLMECLG